MTELISVSEAAARLQALATSWQDVHANERAVFQPWMIRFCEALGVAAPDLPTDDYRFELPVKVVDRDGNETSNFIDCWKRDHVAVEAKVIEAGKRDDLLLRKAFGQVRTYVAHVPGTPPPYLMVVDVAKTIIVWERWSGSYGDFAAGRRIAIPSLHDRPDDIALLQDIFARPSVRDPRGRAQAVTKDIAGRLALLSAALESRGLDQERVARFLMRCVFSCFAEDVGLLPAELFRNTLQTAKASGNVEQLTRALTSLWQTMDAGGMFGAALLHRFNGHFFKTVEALPLEASEVDLLIEAAGYDWSRVEPTIFGTLLVRALDPAERHRLGAEYTPREYIERIVEPTVVEPIRERWRAVQGAVLQLEEAGKKRDIDAATKQLLGFHEWMRGLSFLDPACGSGNFLYVTMAAVKRIELEVLNEIQRLAGGQGGLVLDEVHPRQFHGIEIKPWAREIAELTLWIGYHQFWRESHGGRTPPDPILEDTGTLECRDAVLAWDAIVHRPEKDRPDPTPRIVHPVTGEMVPDPEARLPYYEYENARQAEWPRADFIVGNPPYIGEKRQRAVLGDGYVDALRAAYDDEFSSSDFVMYWWRRASRYVANGATLRAGLITTNSITQSKNRVHITAAREDGASVIWAIPDHPWVVETDGAAVRVAMTVIAFSTALARWLTVSARADDISERACTRLNDDLSPGADVELAAAAALISNAGLCWQGFKLVGDGFLIDADEALHLRDLSAAHVPYIRPWRNGRDLTERPRGLFAIDFALQTEDQARQTAVLFELVRDRVMPDRQANRRAAYARDWWRFGETRPKLRAAVTDLRRYVATVEVSKVRFFTFLDIEIAADGALVIVASADPFTLGVLSSVIHVQWSLAAGGRMGVGNDSRYNKNRCFDAFPFPDASFELRARIAELAERLDQHRKDAIARDERITMTGMYNVVEKLRSASPLTAKERTIHELAACGVLRDLHDELDRLVAESYGWPWPMEKEEILERLVALHDERVEEEKRGLVRWLRPDYQIPRFGAGLREAVLDIDDAAAAPAAAVAAAPLVWPATAVEQLAAVSALVARGALTVDGALGAFSGARRELVARHLETLEIMGEVSVDADGFFRPTEKAA